MSAAIIVGNAPVDDFQLEIDIALEHFPDACVIAVNGSYTKTDFDLAATLHYQCYREIVWNTGEESAVLLSVRGRLAMELPTIRGFYPPNGGGSGLAAVMYAINVLGRKNIVICNTWLQGDYRPMLREWRKSLGSCAARVYTTSEQLRRFFQKLPTNE